eukprot:15230904-Alexandrium_andersonii.AAC.1
MWTWSTATTKGDTIDTRFFHHCIPEEQMCTEAVRQAVNSEVCKLLNWELSVTEAGVWPET